MDAVSVMFLLTLLILETASHLSIKSASAQASRLAGWDFVRALLRHPGFWFGIATFFLLFLAWLVFLARVPLSQGVMVASITIAGVMVGGRIWFKERITPARAAAIALIATGVVLVGWGAA